jgi:outer membrane lipoprotein SlyB
MSPKARTVAITFLICLVSACQSQPTKEDMGSGAGAVLGGVLGAQIGRAK